MGPGRWTGWRLSLLVAGALVACSGFGQTGGAQTVDVARTLKGIEARYNGAQTIEVGFSYTYTFRNRKTVEKGTLFLRKPGKMRWQYSEPAGKLFVSDGNFMYSYIPEEGRAEKTKVKESDDMKAPLAFLLGRLDFQKDFREYRTSPQPGPQGDEVFITALPRSDQMPYTEVSFLVAKDSTIRRLIVKGQENSVMDFTFEGEKRNPPVADAMFHFTPPKGVDIVDLSN
jgi:outer membrane lipoprotein carrier protein